MWLTSTYLSAAAVPEGTAHPERVRDSKDHASWQRPAADATQPECHWLGSRKHCEETATACPAAVPVFDEDTADLIVTGAFADVFKNLAQ